MTAATATVTSPGLGLAAAPAGGASAADVLGPLLWRFRRELAWVGVFSFFVNLLTLTPTLYMLQVFDRVLISRSEFTLIGVSLIMVLFVAMQAVAEWLRTRLLVRVGVRLDEALGERVFDAAFEAQLAQASGQPARPLSDLASLRQFMTGTGVLALFDLPWTLIYIAVLALMHPWLGALGMLFVALQAAMAGVGHVWVAPAATRAAAQGGKAAAFLGAKLRNAETVRAMGMGGNLRRLWLHLHEQHLGLLLAAQRRGLRMASVNKFMQYTQQSLVLALGAWLVIRGELTAGAMVASNALMASALRPIGSLVAVWRQFLDARQAHRRLGDLLGRFTPRAQGLALHAAPAGRVELRGLVARAPGREAPILGGLDLDVAAGEVVAIVGPSGAGKSTLARCLVGIWPGAEGQVLLDGQSLAGWSRDELGPYLGYLPQEVELLDGTLAENIARFGAVDSARVIEAAKAAGIHELALRLPEGYDTPMRAGGGAMSGGQRQRVALARALYGRPRLVVLDEPSANLDDLGVRALGQAITDLKADGSTVFMVLHQRNLLNLADRVLLLCGGGLRWQGRPADLEAALR